MTTETFDTLYSRYQQLQAERIELTAHITRGSISPRSGLSKLKHLDNKIYDVMARQIAIAANPKA